MFKYITASRRCPLCNGSTDCRISSSGSVHCRRTPPYAAPIGYHSGGVDRAGFNVFWPDDADTTMPPATDWTLATPASSSPALPNPATASHSKPSHFTRFFCDSRKMLEAESLYLQHTLGLPASCFAALNVKFIDNAYGRPAWVFPERDGTRTVIGFGVRHVLPSDPAKRQAVPESIKEKMSAGRRGIYIPSVSTLNSLLANQAASPILIVEGASCTLAAMALGLPALGRPNNLSGANYLAEFLGGPAFATDPAPRRIVVMGENDQKPDGTWPGRDGAEHVAAKLSELLPGRTVEVAYPPAAFKDLRAWAIHLNTTDGLVSSLEEGRQEIIGWINDTATLRAPTQEQTPETHHGAHQGGTHQLAAGAAGGAGEGASLLTSLPSHFCEAASTSIANEIELERQERLAAQQAADAAHAEHQAAAYAHAHRFDHLPRAAGCGYCRWLFNPDTGKGILGDTRCGRNCCAFCRAFKAERLNAHVGTLFRKYKTLHTACVTDDRLASVEKQIRRQRCPHTGATGQYTRIIQPNGFFRVIASQPFTGSVPVAPDNAVNTFSTSLDTAEARCRGGRVRGSNQDKFVRLVIFSSGWKIPKRQPSGFEAVPEADKVCADFKVSPTNAIGYVIDCGMDVKFSRSGESATSTSGFTRSICFSTTRNQIIALATCVAHDWETGDHKVIPQELRDRIESMDDWLNGGGQAGGASGQGGQDGTEGIDASLAESLWEATDPQQLHPWGRSRAEWSHSSNNYYPLDECGQIENGGRNGGRAAPPWWSETAQIAT